MCVERHFVVVEAPSCQHQQILMIPEEEKAKTSTHSKKKKKSERKYLSGVLQNTNKFHSLTSPGKETIIHSVKSADAAST